MRIQTVTLPIITLTSGIAIAAFYLLTTPTMEIYGSDCCIYYELARSLLHDHRYWFNFEPHSTYPPGQPLLLAGLMYFFGESFSTLIKFTTLSGLIGVIGVFTHLKRRFDSQLAILVAFLTLSSSFFYLWLTAGLTSDVPYFAMTVWALYCFDIANQPEKSWKRLVAYALTALLTLYCVFLRSIGITFIMGILLWSLSPILPHRPSLSGRDVIERLKKWGPIVALCISALFLWSHWSKSQHPPPPEYDYMSSYSKQLLKKDVHDVDSPQIRLWQLPQRMLDILAIRAANAGKILFNLSWVEKTCTNPLALIPALLILLGWLRSMGQKGGVLEWYFISYISLLILWPFDENGRFLFSVQPFLYLYLIIGTKFLYDSIVNKQLQRFYPVIALFALSMVIYIVIVQMTLGGVSRQKLLSLAFWLALAVGAMTAHFIHRRSYAGMATTKTISFLSNKTRMLAIGTIFLLVLPGWITISRYAHANLTRSPSHISVKKDTAGAIEWINANTLPDDVVIADEAAIVHRLTRRKTFRFPLTTDPVQIWETVREKDFAYIVVPNEVQYEYFLPSTEKRFKILKDFKPESFVLIHEYDSGRIFRVKEQMQE